MAAKKVLPADEILLTMGGIHLLHDNREELKEIAAAFEHLGVKYVGPCHCLGDLARQIFHEVYGNHFIHVGVGKEINLQDLK